MEIVAAVALGALLLFLILYWYKKAPKETNLAAIEVRIVDREQRLLRMYQNLEDLMDSFESYVEDEKAKLAEEYHLVRAQHGIPGPRDGLPGKPESAAPPAPPRNQALFAALEEDVVIDIGRAPTAPLPVAPIAPASVKNAAPAPSLHLAPTPAPTTPSAMHAAGQIAVPRRKPSAKAERVIRLYEQGMDAESIAQELSMAMAEINLVIGMHGGTGRVPDPPGPGHRHE